jgi:hypothetical protein
LVFQNHFIRSCRIPCLPWCVEPAGALIVHFRLTISELPAPFSDFCARLMPLPYLYNSTSLPWVSVGKGTCFIHKKRSTSRTSSRDSCHCHCTSTYPMHGISLNLALSVACYSYYKCHLQPKNETLHWHKSCATRKLAYEHTWYVINSHLDD